MNIPKSILNIIPKSKITSGFVLIAVVTVSYFVFRGDSSAETRYVLAAVERGTIISSITGSGQVSASDQVDVKPKVSGDVIYVGVKNGQEVRAGTLIAQFDSKDAQKAVRDAEINLENANVQLQKMQLNQNNDLPKLQNDIATAETNLTKTYEDAFNTISNAFLELPDILAGIHGILYDSKVAGSSQSNTGAYQNLMDQYNSTKILPMINQALADYLESADKYNKNFDNYKNTTRYSSPEQIVALIDETLETARTMSQTVKDEQNILDTVVLSLKQYQSSKHTPVAITDYQADITKYVGQLNGNISSLLNIQNSIRNSNQSLANSKQTLEYNQQFNPLDVIAQENTIKQREAALQDAQDNLTNFYVRAPFAGVVAKVNVKIGDSASSGTAVATVLTNEQIVDIALNEIDAVKVKEGQRATISFDAVEDLTVTGEVVSVDTLGTVSQGVVSYDVTIVFDIDDERVKPGMSASVSIITEAKQDVLIVPNSAVRYQGANTSVQVMGTEGTPATTQVTVGSSNDTHTEIVSGLQEGDAVVTQTITENTGNSSQSAPQSGGGNSIIPTGGGGFGGGGGGGGGRFPR